ncbi:hypothetical protein FQZ97_769580 [compost metagenome]
MADARHALAGHLDTHFGAGLHLGEGLVGEARLNGGLARQRQQLEHRCALGGGLAVAHQLRHHAAIAGAGEGALQRLAEQALDVVRGHLPFRQVVLQHIEHGGAEGGQRRALGHFAADLHQRRLHHALPRHADHLAGQVDHGRVGMGHEVQLVELVEDVGEGADTDQEDRQAEGQGPQAPEEAHAATGALALARLGEVVALQGVEHVAHGHHLAAGVGGDQVAQGRHFTRAQVVEFATDALALALYGANLELDVDGHAQAIHLEHQLALVMPALFQRAGGVGKAETAGGEVQQLALQCLAVGAEESHLGRHLEARVLPLGLGFVDDVRIAGNTRGCAHYSIPSRLDLSPAGPTALPAPPPYTTLTRTARKTLTAENVMAREDQALNQLWKVARPRSSLVFCRVQDCRSRRKNT